MSFVGRRLVQLVPVAVGVTIIVFFMVHLIPGDPARTILGIHATPRAVAILHAQWGLDRPLAIQYWLILGRLPATVWLIIYSAMLAVLISVPLAMIAASRRDAVRDHIVRAVPLLGLGMPPFWVGFLRIYAFAISFRLFPVSGYGTGLTGHLRSMFLPSLT